MFYRSSPPRPKPNKAILTLQCRSLSKLPPEGLVALLLPWFNVVVSCCENSELCWSLVRF
jgi:hypothetical protein